MELFSNSLPDNGVTAKQNMQWQEALSNTAHQREVADLKAAGINPVLTAGTSGASTPSGGQDSAETLQLLNGLTELVKASHGSGKDLSNLKDKEFSENFFGGLSGAVTAAMFAKDLPQLQRLSEMNDFASKGAQAIGTLANVPILRQLGFSALKGYSKDHYDYEEIYDDHGRVKPPAFVQDNINSSKALGSFAKAIIRRIPKWRLT